MSEQVFHKVQLGAQSGTLAAPGSAVAATVVFPVSAEPVVLDLDRASQYPQEDYGRNSANHAARGYHGVRGVSFTLTGEVRFEDLHWLLERHFAGGISPSGDTRTYPFEVTAPTIIPMTLQTASETTEDQWRATSVVIDELTLEYAALTVPGASPWTFSASCMATQREISAPTAGQSAVAVQTAQGHLTTMAEGTVATAFGSLSALTSSLIRFSITTSRNFAYRKYGGTTDTADAYGFGEKSNATFEAQVKISSTTKSDFHDIWNSSGATLGERRWRVSCAGSGTKALVLDMRAGIFAIPSGGERDGERIYTVTGELVDDATLDALAQLAVTVA